MSSIMQEWKIEPASPLLDTERDAWLFFEDDVDNIQDVDQSEDLHLTRSEVAQQLLQDIDDIVKEEAEPFNDWFEEKMDLEMFECITPVVEDDITAMKQQQQQQQTIMSSAEPQQHLTYEFELTPPQSPPNSLPSTVTYDLFTQLVNVKPLQEQAQPQYTFHYVPEQQQQPQPQPTFITLVSSTEAGMSAPPTPIPDLARELAVVDELVRTRAEDLDSNWDHDQWESETTMSSSCSSSSPRGDTTTSGTEEDEEEEEEEDGDPEWVPSSGTTTSNNINSKPNRRVKPYVRSSNPEDKKLRKKEQNKTAATRYRQKKKAEVSEILEEERVLQDRNEQLKSDMEDVTREIKYLKSLMREILIAKNKS